LQQKVDLAFKKAKWQSGHYEDEQRKQRNVRKEKENKLNVEGEFVKQKNKLNSLSKNDKVLRISDLFHQLISSHHVTTISEEI